MNERDILSGTQWTLEKGAAARQGGTYAYLMAALPEGVNKNDLCQAIGAYDNNVIFTTVNRTNVAILTCKSEKDLDNLKSALEFAGCKIQDPQSSESTLTQSPAARPPAKTRPSKEADGQSTEELGLYEKMYRLGGSLQGTVGKVLIVPYLIGATVRGVTGMVEGVETMIDDGGQLFDKILGRDREDLPRRNEYIRGICDALDKSSLRYMVAPYLLGKGIRGVLACGEMAYDGVVDSAVAVSNGFNAAYKGICGEINDVIEKIYDLDRPVHKSGAKKSGVRGTDPGNTVDNNQVVKERFSNKALEFENFLTKPPAQTSPFRPSQNSNFDFSEAETASEPIIKQTTSEDFDNVMSNTVSVGSVGTFQPPATPGPPNTNRSRRV